MTKHKRKGKFRTRLKRQRQSLYAIRDKFGRFRDIESISKALRRDRATEAKLKVKPGQGFHGDLPKVRKLGKR
jgi:hypothetical protein